MTTRVEWFCKYTFLAGPLAGSRGHSVSATTDPGRLRSDVTEHNANPEREVHLEVWRREVTETQETT